MSYTNLQFNALPGWARDLIIKLEQDTAAVTSPNAVIRKGDNTMQTSIQEFFGSNIISAYTRAQALEDGVLVDVSNTAREAGFVFPVAVTRAVFDRYIEVPPGVKMQDADGRLWDVVYMLHNAIKTGNGGEQTTFRVYVRNHNRQSMSARDLVTLKAVCGPDDDSAPCITIMLTTED